MSNPTDIYSTHYVVLAACVARTTGPVIEFGCGEGSTPLLHYMCDVSGRFLASLDADRGWIERFRPYGCPRKHEFYLVDDWSKCFMTRAVKWSVALVDCAPGEARAGIVEALKGNCTYIICHDTETDHDTGANYKYEPVFATFKYRSDFRRFRPYTTVVSDEERFPMEEVDKTWTP